jgi:hypothetical protein
VEIPSGSTFTTRFLPLPYHACAFALFLADVNQFMQGTGKNPNVRFQRRIEPTGEHRLGVHVMKTKIKKGEELLITYG